MPIKRLSVQLANQIAAGEVVERPASVVKELMENAIDAKATAITLEIRNAGKSLIKVTDNGVGIAHDELPLALAPHATSKISKLEDLEAICTLGFRGEALASIASVSKLTLISRTADDPHAYQVEVVGAEHNPVVSPSAHLVGTSVIVKELFFNTPARRRFLKSDKTEFNHIKELFIRLALVNYQIAFKFVADGKNVINVPASTKDNLLQRIGKLLGTEFSKEGWYFDTLSPEYEAFVKKQEENTTHLFALAPPSAEQKAHKVDIFGVLLRPPTLSKALPDKLLTFLNGRAIADKVVNHAIKDGYMSAMLEKSDAFKPCIRGVLFMYCDPHVVDVNVHPRKDEVRFHNTNYIHDQIVCAVRNALQMHGINKDNIATPFLAVEEHGLAEAKIEGAIPNQLEKIQDFNSTNAQSQTNQSSTIISPWDRLDIEFAKVKVQKHDLFEHKKPINGDYNQRYSQAVEKYLDQSKRELQPLVSVENFTDPVNSDEQNSEFASEPMAHGQFIGRLCVATNYASEYEEQIKQQDLKSLTDAQAFVNNFNQTDSGTASFYKPKFENNLAPNIANHFAPNSANNLASNITNNFGSELGSNVSSNTMPSALNEQVDELLEEEYDYEELELPAELSTNADPNLNLIPNRAKLEEANGAENNQGLNSSDKSSQFNVESPNVGFDENDEEDGVDLAASSIINQGTYDGREEEEQRHLKNRQLSSSLNEAFNLDLDEQKRKQFELFAQAEATRMPAPNSKEAAIARLNFQAQVRKENIIEQIGKHSTQCVKEYMSSTLNQNSEFLSLVAPDIILFKLEQRFFMARGSELYYCTCDQNYAKAVAEDNVQTHELSMPFNLMADPILLKAYKQKEILQAAYRCGFSLSVKNNRNYIEISAIPSIIKGCNLAEVAINALHMIAGAANKINNEHTCPLQLSAMMARTRPFKVDNNLDGKMVVARLNSIEDLTKVAHEGDVKELNLLDIALSILHQNFS